MNAAKGPFLPQKKAPAFARASFCIFQFRLEIACKADGQLAFAAGFF